VGRAKPTITPKVKDLPTEVYIEFERICEDSETFQPKYESSLWEKIGLGQESPYENWSLGYRHLTFETIGLGMSNGIAALYLANIANRLKIQ